MVATQQRLTKEQVLQMVEEQHIEFIRIEFLDYTGVTRGRTIRKDSLKSALEKGVNFSTAIMDFTMFDTYVPDPVYGANGGDFFAMPDPETFAILPHRKQTARMFCDLVDENGNPWEGCPRGALKRLLHEAEALLGGKIFMAYEQEAYLLKEEEGRLVPADNSTCFSSDGVDIQEEFVQKFVETIGKMGVETEQISSEYGPGQLEINLKYDHCLKATEDQITFKQLFKHLARDMGMIGTLAPKPFNDFAGSGLHVHMSLYNEDNNLFKDLNDEKGLELSENAYYFIGGILHHGRSIVAIGAPTMNSYKRMVPGSWAPAHICYGSGNRSVLVRVPEKRRERRFEFRGADGTCNPYLLSAALIAAGLHGIRKRIDPGEPLEVDAGNLSNNELEAMGIEWVPRNLQEAMDSLAKDTILADSIGRPIWQEFIKVKREEWNKHFYRIDEWERSQYAVLY
ncbi:glutamine synthetase family protein [Pseudobacillus wudalianchiensis]|uniref:Glutamine synthetase n=1 Tax=Pseudobacillus wudalianchiensis TaxID=1743143 RepID=A0A1B9AY59_9BACI|nr:glutamine synthetase family protein [Bacillus wudalianchiensis]OCA88736.1 glutamine synthetase [Bacillus wudalianchiensis]